jgi:hypothetical protein
VISAAAPSAGRLRQLRDDAPLQGRTPPTLLSYTLLSPLRVALLPIGITTHAPHRLDHPWAANCTHSRHSTQHCLPSRFCSLPVFTRAQSHQHNGRLRSDIRFTVLSNTISTPAVSAKAACCVVEPQNRTNLSSSCHRLSRLFGRRQAQSPA